VSEPVLPQPALLSGISAGSSSASGTLTVSARGSIVAVGAADPATTAEVATVEKIPAPRTATSGDYGLVLVPLTMGFSVFGVLATVADPATGAVWGVAMFLVTIIAMHDEDFSKLVARLADYLKHSE
jgi:hypothetical protein